MEKQKQNLLNEALGNIRSDRSKINKLLKDLQREITSQEVTNSKAGPVAAKYVETLQRSNEQLVKLVTLMLKKSSGEEDVELSENEKDNMFELIQGAAEK